MKSSQTIAPQRPSTAAITKIDKNTDSRKDKEKPLNKNSFNQVKPNTYLKPRTMASGHQTIQKSPERTMKDDVARVQAQINKVMTDLENQTLPPTIHLVNKKSEYHNETPPSKLQQINEDMQYFSSKSGSGRKDIGNSIEVSPVHGNGNHGDHRLIDQVNNVIEMPISTVVKSSMLNSLIETKI
jgi:hypothetical protein